MKQEEIMDTLNYFKRRKRMHLDDLIQKHENVAIEALEKQLKKEQIECFILKEFEIPETYFKNREDTKMTDEEIIEVIKGTETATFTLPMMGCQEIPTSRFKFLVDMWESRRE